MAAWERCQQSLAGGVSTGLRASMRPHPLFFERGVGSHLHDVDGHEYVDYVLGWGPLLLGHSHPRVLAAVGEQLPLGQTFGSGHHLEYETAELVLDAVPGAERVLWSNTGSEADQVALRLARAFTGRQRVVKFVGHYHGWGDSALASYRGVACGNQPAPGSRGQSSAALSDVSVAEWNNIESVRAILEDPAQDVAALIAEPVVCNTGVVPPAPGFLEDLRELCTRTGALLVFDEVITGFRLALGGATEHYGVQADLVVLAKGIASGFPLSAVTGRADVIDQVTNGVVHAGTYNGNPVVLAAAHATIQVLREEMPYQALQVRTGRLVEHFGASLRRHGVVGSAHHVGPVAQVVLGRETVPTVAEYLSTDWTSYDALTVALLRRGVFTLPGGRWYLSTAHDDEDVERTVKAFDRAVESLVADGILGADRPRGSFSGVGVAQ